MNGRLLCVVALTLSPAIMSRAWDSKCYKDDGKECDWGPDTARHRWVGPRTEHRMLFHIAANGSGIPPQLFAEFELPVFTDGRILADGSRTLLPAPFNKIAAREVRKVTLAELAQLPDFSYSVLDWARANEICPLNGFLAQDLDTITCHVYEGHLGALNSSHMAPQAKRFYAHFHGLALRRADACKAMRDSMSPDDEVRFKEFLGACDTEAFMFEATGQHFLQDAWSSGHMWDRWGSPDPRDLPSMSLTHGMAIALTVGLIHGARAVFQDYEPAASGFLSALIDPTTVVEVNDALNAHHPDVRFQDGNLGSPLLFCVGDTYANNLVLDPAYGKQFRSMLSCSVSSLRKVYAATGAPAPEPMDPDLTDVDPLSDACFGQRVTNAAIAKGAGLDVVVEPGIQLHVPFEPQLVSIFVIGFSEHLGGEPLAAEDRRRLYLSMTGVATVIAMQAAPNQAPNETTLASGGLPPLLGIEQGGAYLDRLPPYLEPPLPWTEEAGPEAADLARVFHQGHAKEWCDSFGAGRNADLENLKARIATFPPGTPERAAALDACVEFSRRSLRVGSGPDDYDHAREPLCHFIASNPNAVQYVYEPDGEPPLDVRELATRHCDPPPAILSITDVGGCPGDMAQFKAIVTDGATAFTWDFGGGAAPAISTDAEPVVTLATAGTYYGTLAVTFGPGRTASRAFEFTVSEAWSERSYSGHYSFSDIEDWVEFGYYCTLEAPASASIVMSHGEPWLRISWSDGSVAGADCYEPSGTIAWRLPSIPSQIPTTCTGFTQHVLIEGDTSGSVDETLVVGPTALTYSYDRHIVGCEEDEVTSGCGYIDEVRRFQGSAP